MNDQISALRLFSRVARTESFSRAAREAGLAQPSVSRIIARLERHVGAALLVRTTRAVRLTEAGADYLARVEPILAALDEADQAARGGAELRGLLRIALSSSFGVREVIPRLAGFLDAHPALRVELMVSDQRQDLVMEGADMALRLGSLPDSSATARRLGEAPGLLVASPDYLARAGHPASPSDLSRHALVRGPHGQSSMTWSFRRTGRQVSIRPEGRIVVGTNEAATAAAVAGLGIVATALWGCRRELEDGRLTRVLTDWEMEPVEVHAVFPAGRAAPPAARAFADHLARALQAKSAMGE